MFDDRRVAVEVSGRTKSGGDNVWLQRGVTVKWNVTSIYKARERTLALRLVSCRRPKCGSTGRDKLEVSVPP